MNPTAKDIGVLLWTLADWEARFPGYAIDHRLQTAVSAAILPRDREALDDANANPYLCRPTREEAIEAAR